MALEDHAFRACLASLDLQEEANRLAVEVNRPDGIDLQLRVGVNSGEVIAGDIGAGPSGYTAIGEQVGLAQRMESVAPPRGVMLSESTARLVDEAVILDEPESVSIKGSDRPVRARRLLGVAEHRTIGRRDSTLVGRQWELAALTGVLDRSVTGSGCVVALVAAPGIGKSRLVAELAAAAAASADENAALIAEHLESAGDLPAAYGWHMRAATWSTSRDIVAAHTSFRRARDVADRLPVDSPDYLPMRIAPRTLLCASAFRVGGSGADVGFDELRELCEAAGDKRSLAIGMTGLVMHAFATHREEGSAMASEHIRLLESIGDDVLTVGLSFVAMVTKSQAGEMAEVLRLAEQVIDLADGDPRKGNLVLGSPLALALTYRGIARCATGSPGWRDDFLEAVDMARSADTVTLAIVVFFIYVSTIPWVLPADATAMGLTEEALATAERSGDDLSLDIARSARGVVLFFQRGHDHEAGLALLDQMRGEIVNNRFSYAMLGFIDILIATEKANTGDLDAAIAISRAVTDDLFPSGETIWPFATNVLVESLLRRDARGDVAAARAALDRAEAVPLIGDLASLSPHYLRLRALLARAEGDEQGYRELVARYRATATSLGFHGHIAAAEAMI